MVEIRKATALDESGIWEIIYEVISGGDTYTFYPDSPKQSMLNYWCASGKHTYVAVEAGKVAGTFILKENQPGLGSHIANASYMVAKKSRGKKIGEAMAKFSLMEAKQLGFTAMQFNIVVKSNTTAVNLWLRLGFNIIGEIPDAFNHVRDGFTNAYIMYRRL